jgi:NTE family protein
MAPSQPMANVSFDKLFVPFKAMGAEVFTQHEVLLDHGNLVAALRATMSVPFVYRPIKIDGQYIFDGGVYNNFPVESMKAYYEPDVMIWVNVASRVYDECPKAKAEQMISSSLLFMIMDKADPKKLGANGVFITPDMENASGFDFSNPQVIIDSGYTAAIRNMPQLLQTIKRRVDPDSLATARAAFKQQQPLKFTQIVLAAFTANQEAFIKKAMFKNDIEQRSIEEIKANYYKLAAEPYFSDIFPTISYNEQKASYSLELSAEIDQKIGLQIGGNIASNNLSNIYLGASLDMLNRYLFNHYLTGQIGSVYKSLEYNLRINFAFRHPIYIAPIYEYQQYDYANVTGFVLRREKQNISTDRQIFGMQLGMPFLEKSKLRFHLMGFENKDRHGENSFFQNPDSLFSYRYGGAFASADIAYNTLNKRVFATEGKQHSWQQPTSMDSKRKEMQQQKNKLYYCMPIVKHTTLCAMAALALTSQDSYLQ